MTGGVDRDLARSDDFEVIGMHHDRGGFVESDTKQGRISSTIGRDGGVGEKAHTAPRTLKEPMIVAPAELPAMTPPRAKKVYQLVLGAGIEAARALRKSSTKTSESATWRSRVWSSVALVAPAYRRQRVKMRSQISGPTLPPPMMMSQPSGGP